MPPRDPSKKKATYVPNYMSKEAVEPCVVCGAAATGYHYRALTCEGCKGFFRRTRQKGLESQYSCKMKGSCVINVSTRNQCMFCRYTKCVNAGMSIELVLDKDQRMAKRQLIEENRERRKMGQLRAKIIHDLITNKMTDTDRSLIQAMMAVFYKVLAPQPIIAENVDGFDQQTVYDAYSMAERAIEKLVHFTASIPGFRQLADSDQMLLMKTCCLEMMVLRAALRYDKASGSVVLCNGRFVNKLTFTNPMNEDEVLARGLARFADSLARHNVDMAEVVLMMGLMLTNARLPKVKGVEALQQINGEMTGALRRYTAETYPNESSRYGRILMKLRWLASS
ncbi:hypothetical protein RvY_18072-2 [Ramazzottius varieornatus]|uniref:Uncharacterized protein n=1 Tax=Ramazzottius varieornatus TaxID=947166 RepID=A0A1D1W9U3_RAMVA|nr:hypothetical protein RvY_18072-2 [Ramazzottius varieornatus]